MGISCPRKPCCSSVVQHLRAVLPLFLEACCCCYQISIEFLFGAKTIASEARGGKVEFKPPNSGHCR